MIREWKPGDVALARIKPKVDGRDVTGGWSPVIRDNTGSWASGAAMGREVFDRDIIEIRPLVVIDPADREQMERLLDAHNKAEQEAACKGGECGSGSCWIDIMRGTFREFAAPKPPRPDEPQGLGAVVEDAEGYAYIRIHVRDDIDFSWSVVDEAANKGFRMWKWADIDVVRVLSEGVQS